MKFELYYLIASLPTLQLWEKNDISPSTLLKKSRTYLSAVDFDTLKRCRLFALEEKEVPRAVQEWYEWERRLRNQLACIRAEKHNLPPQKYLRGERCQITLRVREIGEMESPHLASEALYLLRWDGIKRLQVYQYFDFPFLALYYLHLQLSGEFHDRRSSSGKNKVINIMRKVRDGSP